MKIRKFISAGVYTYLVGLSVLVCLVPAQSLADTLKLTTVNWQPFYGENLPEKGFFSVIVRETFKRAGYDINIEFQPWKRALEATRKGKYDGLLGAYYTEERSTFLHYSDVVMENKDVFISKDKQLSNYQHLDELKPYQIALIRASAPAEELQQQGFQVVETNDDLQAFRMLLKDRVALVLTSEKHYHYIMEQDVDLKANRDKFVLLQKPYKTYPLYVPISKSRADSEKVVERFNEALADIKRDGTYTRILKQAGFLTAAD